MYIHICVSGYSVCIHTSLYFLALSFKRTSQDPVVMNTLVPRSCSLIPFPAKKNQSSSEKGIPRAGAEYVKDMPVTSCFTRKKALKNVMGNVMHYKPIQ